MRASAWITWSAEPKRDELEIVPAIDPNLTVEIMCRNGELWRRKANSVYWHQLPNGAEIVAYRIIWSR